MLLEIGPNLTTVLMEHLNQIGCFTNDKDRGETLSEFCEVIKHLLDKTKEEYEK